MNLFERAIAFVSPARALRRARDRAALRIYEGAEPAGPRASAWRGARGSSANTELSNALTRLRDRSRDLARNSPWAPRMLDIYVASAVGCGLRPVPHTGSDRLDAKVMKLWEEWNKEADAEGMLSFDAQQGLAMRSCIESGEVVGRFIEQDMRSNGRSKVPLKFQLLESDFIDASRDGLVGQIPDKALPKNTDRSRLGVGLGSNDRRTGLWLYPVHPGEITTANLKQAAAWSNFVPIDELVHMFRVLRPGQVRGVSWFAPIISTAREIKDFMDAVVVKARVEACFSGFIINGPEGESVLNPMDPQSPYQPGNDFTGTTLEPGMIRELRLGQDVKFAAPTTTSQVEPVLMNELMAMAAGVGCTYDQVTGDLRGANYSSLRAGKIDFRALVEQTQNLMLIPRLCEPMWDRFIARAILAGELNERADGYRCDWVTPAWPSVNPKFDQDAQERSVRAGRMSPQDYVAEWGYDWRQVIDNWAEYLAYCDEKGVKLDIDPRQFTRAGVAQPQPQQGGAPGAPPPGSNGSGAPKNGGGGNGSGGGTNGFHLADANGEPIDLDQLQELIDQADMEGRDASDLRTWFAVLQRRDFDETQHPRDDKGQFTDKGGSEGGGSGHMPTPKVVSKPNGKPNGKTIEVKPAPAPSLTSAITVTGEKPKPAEKKAEEIVAAATAAEKMDTAVHQLTAEAIMTESPDIKKNSVNVTQIARDLNERAGRIIKETFGQDAITESSPATDEFLANVIVADLKAGMKNGHSSPTWYSDKMRDAMQIATEMHPELGTDPGKRFAYMVSLAITSQGEVVSSTVRLTEDAYKYFAGNGKFRTDLKVATPSINENFQKVNEFIDQYGVLGTKELFDREFTKKELKDATGYDVGDTLVNATVNGSAVLGPKIGNGFYQNLNGNFKRLTIDRWFMRSWGRITNTGIDTKIDMTKVADRLRNALRDEGRPAPQSLAALNKIATQVHAQHERDYRKHNADYKSGVRKKTELVYASSRFVYHYDGAMVDDVRGGGNRAWIESVFGKVLDKFKAQGIDMTMAAAQATWWNPEQVLYRHLGGRVKESDNDYAKGLRKYADSLTGRAMTMGDEDLLQSAPWIDDPDEPDRMTPEQIKRMVAGFAELAPDIAAKAKDAKARAAATIEQLRAADPEQFAALIDQVREWDETQHPRDEKGQFTEVGGGDGGGGGGGSAPAATGKPGAVAPGVKPTTVGPTGVEFVSPNVQSNLDFPGAVDAIESEQQQSLHDASHFINSALNIDAHEYDIIGAWADGAENSVMDVVASSNWDKLMLSGAMKGHIADQKSVLIFQQQDGGTSALSKFEAKGELADIHRDLLADGLAFHTLVPHEGGATVYVADLDGSAADAVEKAAERYDASVEVQFGRAEFIGTQKTDGTDREQRDDAKRVYEEIIEQSKIQGSSALWAGVSDRWGEGKAPGFVGEGHPGEGYSADAYVKDGVIYTSDVYDAQRALFENRKVELDQPRSVSVLLDVLGKTAQRMIEQGTKAPVFNLCNVTVSGTNLFCADTIGIPRVQMPQLNDEQTVEFRKYLEGKYTVTDEDQFASHLRATQNELNGAKVAGVANFLQNHPEHYSKRVIISRDDYILDGHHHWAAKVGLDAADNNLTNDTKMPVSRVDISITQLLAEAEKFTGGKGKKSAEETTTSRAADFDESKHPRDEKGQFTDSGGGEGGGGTAKGGGTKASAAKAGGGQSGKTHPGEGYSEKAYVDEHGVIHTSNVYDAQRALFENRRVELKQIKQVSTLIQRLGETAAEMAEHGEKAPVFNLCNVSVEGTNLFCAETVGIPRVEMPVITRTQTKDFIKYLKKQGYAVEKDNERAANLRATQNEISGEKVAAAVEKIKQKGFYKRLVVSRDDYILDGHHTWAGQLAIDAADNSLVDDDKSVKIARVDISITKLLEEAEKWTGGAGKKAADEGVKRAAEQDDDDDDDDAFDGMTPEDIDELLEERGGAPDRPFRVVRDFDESKHPRDEKGQFTDAGGGEGGGAGASGAPAAPPTAVSEPPLDPAVTNVGGDDWNRDTATRLEREYQQTKDEISKLAEGSVTKPTVTYSDDDEEDVNFSPEDWSMVGGEEQEQIFEEWKQSSYGEFYQSEVDNYYESGNALDDTKANMAYDGTAAGAEWALDALKELREERAANDEPKIPFTDDQILDAVTLAYESGYEGTKDPDIGFNDSKLTAPEGFDASPTLPGIEPEQPSTRLTKEMRDAIVATLTKAFNDKADHDASDQEVPEYLNENISEYQDQYWDGASDDFKFEWGKNNGHFEEPSVDAPVSVSGLPVQYDPLGERDTTLDYRRTQALGRRLSLDAAKMELRERGIIPDEGKAERAARVFDGSLWRDWKGSSTSSNGKLLQAAIASELGGRLRGIEMDKMREYADREFKSEGGWLGVKAYVRAKWETTQYLLDKAGKSTVQLYRAVSVPLVQRPLIGFIPASESVTGTAQHVVKDPADKTELAVFDTVDEAKKFAEEWMQTNPNLAAQATKVKGYDRLDNIKLERNGAASTTTDRTVANGWGSTNNRVVLRIDVPRTAVVSVPAYGQNSFHEHEVVIAGTAWKQWEAWQGTAPSFEHVAMAARGLMQRAKSKEIVIDLLDIDMKAGKNWLAIDPAAKLGDKRDVIRKKNRDKHVAEQNAKHRKAKAGR